MDNHGSKGRQFRLTYLPPADDCVDFDLGQNLGLVLFPRYSVKPRDKVAESAVGEKKEQSMLDCSIVEKLRAKPI